MNQIVIALRAHDGTYVHENCGSKEHKLYVSDFNFGEHGTFNIIHPVLDYRDIFVPKPVEELHDGVEIALRTFHGYCVSAGIRGFEAVIADAHVPLDDETFVVEAIDPDRKVLGGSRIALRTKQGYYLSECIPFSLQSFPFIVANTQSIGEHETFTLVGVVGLPHKAEPVVPEPPTVRVSETRLRDTLFSITVYASDKYSNAALDGEVFIEGQCVGRTNTAFQYERQTEIKWVIDRDEAVRPGENPKKHKQIVIGAQTGVVHVPNYPEVPFTLSQHRYADLN